MDERRTHPTPQHSGTITDVCVCVICRLPLPEAVPFDRGRAAFHGWCVQAGAELIGVTAALLAEPRGVPFCTGCLAAELGSGPIEIQSALWHLARTLHLLPGSCRCGAAGWQLT